jgi:poly(3-hydroxybutyrate) depolymerase
MTTQSSLFALAVAASAALPLVACSDEPIITPQPVAGASGQAATAGGPGSGGNASAGSAAQTAGTSAAGTSNTVGGGGASAGGAAGSSSGGGAKGGAAGAAGSGGSSSSAGGSSGGSGGGGGGGGGKVDEKKSLGCGTSSTQTLGQFVESMVMTSGANRPYSVRLPTGYSPMRAYPVIVLLHGCGGGTNNVAMEKSTGADAILIRGTGSAAGTCWDTKASGPDVAFFDAMVLDVKKRFCTDEHRFFAVGYSSGSWLANQLTCIRADVLRGAGTVTGGESASGQCGGPVARIFIHDEGDNDNQISGSVKARDRQLTQNMCDKSATPQAVDPSPCKLYQGCAAGYPVEWCQTTGQGHNRQDSLAGPAFWNFFKAL